LCWTCFNPQVEMKRFIKKQGGCEKILHKMREILLKC
jgi:hypothetical protein